MVNNLSDPSAQTGNRTSPRPWEWALLALALLVVAISGWRTLGQTGIWTHLASGQAGFMRLDRLTFTVAGQPWINPFWLYDQAVAGLWSLGGMPLVTLAHIALVLGALALLLPTALRLGGPLATSAALLLATWLLAPRFTPSPSLAGLFCFALAFRLLDAQLPLRRLACALAPLQVLWANLTPSFLWGWALCLLFAAQTFSTRTVSADGAPAERRAAQLGLLALGLLVASLINPYAFRLIPLAVRLALSGPQAFTAEWITPFLDLFGPSPARHVLTLALLIGAVGLITTRERLPVALTTTTVLTALIAIRSLYRLEWFALTAFPFLALSLRTAAQSLAGIRPPATVGRLRAATALLLAGGLLLTARQFVSGAYYRREGSVSQFMLGPARDFLPTGVLAEIETGALPPRWLHLPGDGGFLAVHLPAPAISCDQRRGLYPDPWLIQLHRALLRGDQDSLRALMNAHETDGVLLCLRTPGAATGARLLMARGWQLAYFDGISAALLPPDHPAPDPLVQRRGVERLQHTIAAYRAQVARGRAAPLPSALIGAGSFYLSLERFPEARALYQLLARAAPQMPAAWLRLGIVRLQLEQPAAAREALLRARSLIPREAGVWLWLSRAETALGDPAAAQAAFTKAAKLNPELAAQFGNPLDAAPTKNLDPPPPTP